MIREIFEGFVDFLFPKSAEILDLENLSASALLEKLTPAIDIDESTIAIWNYADENVRKLIWELKYRQNSKVVEHLAAVLFDVLKTELAERGIFENFNNPILVPIPMSAERRRERGYNQTESLCEAVLKLDSEKLLEYKPDLLEKVKHTASQTLIKNRKLRLENMENSMKSSAEAKGRNIIVVDDVTTTGATFRDARRALREAGAKKILCVALAH